ncbi:MAG: biotin--[acetyl-CoA-carboxylase] ligase [Flavobacteriales bacterium]
MSGSIIHLSVVDSTNIYTTKQLSQSGMKEWTTVMADSQSLGKGQRGRKWDSEFGRNLLCSTVVKPVHLRVREQFLVSAAASISVCLTLMDFGMEAQIKWPNDILVNGRKIAGLLIENQLAQDCIESSVVGLGLNVNQDEFNNYPWPATSMVKEASNQFDREEVLHAFRDHFKTMLEATSRSKIALLNQYNELLYAKGEVISFQIGDLAFSARLKGVTLLGELVIEENGKEKQYVNGEIRLSRISA